MMFVRSLEIKSPASHGHLPSTKLKLSADKNQGLVDAGSLVSFVNDIGEQERADVLNSTLLAQLASDKKFDREKDTKNWYNFYRTVLSNVGWVVQEFHFEEYKSKSASLQISKVIIEILADLVTENELAAVQRVMESLENPDNKPWWDIFSTESSGPSSNGNMQILPCKVDKSGQVVMCLGTFYFSASSTETRWFWFNYSSTDIHMYKGAQISTLNMSVYDQVRQEVIEKLGDNAKNFVHNLPDVKPAK